MYLMKQKQTHRYKEQTYGFPGKSGRDGLGVWDQQMQTIIQRMDKYQGTSVQHRELYSISCDKPQWNGNEHEKVQLYICITESVIYCRAEINTTL